MPEGCAKKRIEESNDTQNDAQGIIQRGGVASKTEASSSWFASVGRVLAC